ncbi:class I SAM-dependent methyltransferase [Desulfobacula toluolica]|uniref:Predicted methyltransferase, type 12 n=1 Tax=Desulfobacula toluolica (strain DSM 7467 / Tol2) TaxID=651182 RepID=K0NB33_DESTT|nr:class I SAM-dependent methyltransferase [Desulfobacula toluolica]CCK81474.1 predicted methyltransferase, type 12 [Desulfobacula toluolica Tol2]
MDNIFNKKFWLTEWEKDKQTDTYNVHKGFSTPEYWDKAAQTYNQNKKEVRDRRLEKTLEFLERSGLLFKGMTVLEIGCGTGMLAIELAKQGAKVTALDFSQGMLSVFKQNIPNEIKEQITILHENWYKTDIAANGWEKKFDLVIAFMSPGVAGPDSFFKMMSCSKKGCAIRGWAAKRKHTILSDLWQKIMGIPLEDKPQSILYKINLLFSMGFFPEITFDTIEWEQTVSIKDEFDSQMAFFQKVSNKPEGELEEIIRRHLDTVSTPDNHIVRQHKGLTATAVWIIDKSYP